MKIFYKDYDEEYAEGLGEFYETDWLFSFNNGKYQYSVGIPSFDEDDEIPMYLKIHRYEGDYITGVCRISLLSPEYIEGYNENFKLSHEEKEKFVELLNSNIALEEVPISNGDNRVAVMMTQWEFILEFLDRIMFRFKEETRFYQERNGKYKMPNYLLLKEDS